MNNPEVIVKQAEEAYQTQDIDRIMQFFNPNIVVYWNGQKIIEGLDELRKWHEKWGVRKDFKIKKKLRAASGNIIAVEWSSTWVDDSGDKNESFGGEFWTMENGCMSEWHAYYARYVKDQPA